jgi:hypothetical protein
VLGFVCRSWDFPSLVPIGVGMEDLVRVPPPVGAGERHRSSELTEIPQALSSHSGNWASNRVPGDDGWDHTASGSISPLPRSALPKRRHRHIAWGRLGAIAGRMLFVSP